MRAVLLQYFVRGPLLFKSREIHYVICSKPHRSALHRHYLPAYDRLHIYMHYRTYIEQYGWYIHHNGRVAHPL